MWLPINSKKGQKEVLNWMDCYLMFKEIWKRGEMNCDNNLIQKKWEYTLKILRKKPRNHKNCFLEELDFLFASYKNEKCEY